MGHAAGQRADCLHLLGLAQFFFTFANFFFGMFSHRDLILQRGFPRLDIGRHFFNAPGDAGKLNVVNLVESVSIISLRHAVDALLEAIERFAHKNAQQDSGGHKNHHQGNNQHQQNGVAQPGQVLINGPQ